MRYVGVDLSRNSFTACFLDQDDSYHIASFPLSEEGLSAFRRQLSSADRLAVEAGPNAYFFYDQVVAAVTEIVLVSPGQFAVIARSKKKTDRQDAVTLARFLKLDCLPTVVVPSRRIRELRQLFTTREGLVKMGRQLKNTGHAALARNGLPGRRSDFASHSGRERLGHLPGLAACDRLIRDMVLRQIDTIEKELDELDKAIVHMGKPLPGLPQLLQVRGFGLVAAIGALPEIGDITRFAKAKQLVSYAGLATTVRQSGAVERRGPYGEAGERYSFP